MAPNLGDGAPFNVQQALLQLNDCITLESLEVKSNGVGAQYKQATGRLNKDLQQHFNKNLKSTCVKKEQLFELLKVGTNSLVSRGYVTSVITYPDQNLKTGVLQALIVWGNVGELQAQQPISKNVYPMQAGDVLNMRDVEQIQANLEALPSVQAGIDLVPSDALNATDLVIKTEAAKAARLSSNTSSEWSAETYNVRQSLSLDVDQVFGLFDLLNIGISKSLLDKKDDDSTGYNLSWSVPFGYHKVQVGLNNSAYQSAFEGQQARIYNNGDQTNFYVGLDSLLSRSQKGSSTLTSKLQSTNAKNYINGVRLSTSSLRTDKFELGLNTSRFLSATAQCALGAKLSHGKVSLADVPDFAKAELNVDCSTQLKGLMLGGGANTMQSNKAIVLSEQYSLLGDGGVPGFRQSINGSSGSGGNLFISGALTNKWLPAFINPVQAKLKMASATIPRAEDNIQNGRLSGLELSLNTKIKRATVNVSAARGLGHLSSEGYKPELIARVNISLPVGRWK